MAAGLVCTILLVALASAAWLEYRAQTRTLERPRPVTAALALAATSFTFLLVIVVHRPTARLWLPATMMLVPLACALLGAIRFPTGVPTRDASCVTAFFAFVAAASLHGLFVLWQHTMDEEPSIRLVRRATMALSVTAVTAHAMLLGVRQCAGLWRFSRISFAFAGILRIAAAVTLYLLGVTGDNFPPASAGAGTGLDFPTSLFVNAMYVTMAVVFTPHRRLSLSSFISMIAGAWTATAAGNAAAHGQRCVICLEAPTANLAFVPCGHICTCEPCSNAIVTSTIQPAQCPLCREDIQSRLKTFRI